MVPTKSYAGWIGPLVGVLAGAYLAARSGKPGGAMTTGIYVGLGFAGGCVVFLIDWMEAKARTSTAPSAALSRLILGAVPFTFWIPFLGLLVCSVALYRSAWLQLPEWMAFCLSCFFYLSVSITAVTVFIFVMEHFGML